MKTILKMLFENEKALADLYRIYADKFPGHKEFWTSLADEEINHFKALEELSSGTIPDVMLKEDKIDTKLIQISLDYIDEKQKQAKIEPISHRDALKTALEFETSMIEQGFFEIFEGDSPEFWRTIEKLVFETKIHTERIRKEVAKKSWDFF